MPGEKSGEGKKKKKATTGCFSMIMCKTSNCLKMSSVQGNEVGFPASAEDNSVEFCFYKIRLVIYHYQRTRHFFTAFPGEWEIGADKRSGM